MTAVVIDTNVLVSALLFGGRPGRLAPLRQARRIVPYASAAIVDEYLRVLANPRLELTESEIQPCSTGRSCRTSRSSRSRTARR